MSRTSNSKHKSAHLGVSYRLWLGAIRSADYSSGSVQKLHCRWDTRQTPHPQCNTTSRLVLWYNHVTEDYKKKNSADQLGGGREAKMHNSTQAKTLIYFPLVVLETQRVVWSSEQGLQLKDEPGSKSSSSRSHMCLPISAQTRCNATMSFF